MPPQGRVARSPGPGLVVRRSNSSTFLPHGLALGQVTPPPSIKPLGFEQCPPIAATRSFYPGSAIPPHAAKRESKDCRTTNLCTWGLTLMSSHGRTQAVGYVERHLWCDMGFGNSAEFGESRVANAQWALLHAPLPRNASAPFRPLALSGTQRLNCEHPALDTNVGTFTCFVPVRRTTYSPVFSGGTCGLAHFETAAHSDSASISSMSAALSPSSCFRIASLTSSCRRHFPSDNPVVR